MNDSNITSIPYYFLITLISKFLRKKVIFFSIGIGPVKRKSLRFLMKQIFSLSNFIFLRDKKSYTYTLKNLKLSKNKISLIPDIAFSLSKDASLKSEPFIWTNKQQNNSFFNPTKNLKKKKIFISIIPYGKKDIWYFENTKIYNQYIENMSIFIEKLYFSKNNLEIILFPINTKQDVLAINDLLKEINNEVKVSYITPFSVSELLQNLSQANYIVASRLHSTIFSTILSKPFISLSYQEKVFNYLTDINMQMYNIDIKEFEPIKLYNLFEVMLNNEKKISLHLKTEYNKNINQLQLLQSNFNLLYEEKK